MGKEIKWVLGQGAGVISPWNGGLMILSRRKDCMSGNVYLNHEYKG